MNRKVFATTLSLLLLVGGGIALADDTKTMESSKETKVTTTAGTTKSHSDTCIGTVKAYEAGKTLKVTVGKKTRSFPLDAAKTTVSMDPSVAVGQKVKVVKAKNADGTKSITVTPAS